MTLREMIRRNPAMFYPQTWYENETFLDAEPRTWLGWPSRVADFVPGPGDHVDFTAADLAALWLDSPDTRPLWSRYLWTDSYDHAMQRVYVGVNNGLFEIHRHIHLTERFGVPC